VIGITVKQIATIYSDVVKDACPEEMANMTALAQCSFPAAREIFFKLAFAMDIIVAGWELASLIYSRLPCDPVRGFVARDFVNTWVGAGPVISGHPHPHFGANACSTLTDRWS
jgi:hypothetical protein